MSNGTPPHWRKDSSWRYGPRKVILTGERPPLDPDPLYVPGDEPVVDNDVRIARLVAAGLILLTVILVVREALP